MQRVLTEPMDCMITDGTPITRMRRIVGPCSFTPRMSMDTSGFMRTFIHRPSAAPIHWPPPHGPAPNGVTIMCTAKQLGDADTLHCLETDIGFDEDAQALTARLAELGAQALAEAVEMLQNGTAVRTPQDHSAHTYAPMLDKSLSPIDWTRSARQIHDQVRGLIPWPCAQTSLGGKTVKVFATQIGEATEAEAGKIIAANKKGITFACGDGLSLRITELQSEGGKRMAAAAYLAGHSVQVEV